MNREVLYGLEAVAPLLTRLGMSRVGPNEWIGRCRDCRETAVFRAETAPNGKTIVLRCPADCAHRRRA